MNGLLSYFTLVRMQLQMMRNEFLILIVVQAAFTIGIVLGFGYFIPNISDGAAYYLTTGTATQAVVTVGLVMLPQNLSQAKTEGRIDYFLTLPISREAYILAQVTVVAVMLTSNGLLVCADRLPAPMMSGRIAAKSLAPFVRKTFKSICGPSFS